MSSAAAAPGGLAGPQRWTEMVLECPPDMVSQTRNGLPVREQGLCSSWWFAKAGGESSRCFSLSGTVAEDTRVSWHMLAFSLQVLTSTQPSCQRRGIIIPGCTGWQDFFCLASCLSSITAPSQCLSGLVFHIFNIISQLFQHECPNVSCAGPRRMSEQ